MLMLIFLRTNETSIRVLRCWLHDVNIDDELYDTNTVLPIN